MSQRRKQYPFDQIEAKWQAHWETSGTFRTLNPGEPGFDPARPKYYVLDMFPYPSGAGLHVGHVEGYTATDIVARHRRKLGYNVLHPMGWDAFGLPAEQYAIRTGQHPRTTTEGNTARFREQLKRIGFSYDWSREIDTTDPGYFRWTQWIFLQLYGSYFDTEANAARPVHELTARRRAGHPGESEADLRAWVDARRLAYIAEAPVNWCPRLGTVLANEEVKDGVSEVGGFAVERRPMRQWMLRITDYAERLADELEDLDWPDGIKALQRNWIGRSEGASVRFALEGHPATIEVFTTRPDTLFGATYMVLAPEHPLVEEITGPAKRAAVEEYRERVASKPDLERIDLSREKSGVSTGARAINPVNGEAIPVWIADYVLMSYGTGAIMAVPAHDERDFEFARAFGLPVRQVVQPAGEEPGGNACFVGEGVNVRSGFLDGMPTPEAKEAVTLWLEERGLGARAVKYKLRDWLFSRQRYWGEPFPIVWDGERHEGLPESELPLLPPDLDDFRPTGEGEPPLARVKDWVQLPDGRRRETNTMPQWAGSCWYYLRFCDSGNGDRFVSEEAERYWMGGERSGGVDLYVGGTEHAVLHLLYARFWHKVLFDLGFVGTREPFQRLINQGLVLGADNQKMSKSRGNVVNPDDVVAAFGADSLRLYEMFMGPLEQGKPWSERGVEGVYRFLGRVWRLAMEPEGEEHWAISARLGDVEPSPALLRVLHETIRKVGEDTESLFFNTAIAQMMIFVNAMTGERIRPVRVLTSFLHVLNPYAPHLSEELNARLHTAFPGLSGAELAYAPWPEWDEAVLAVSEVEIVVQINGKLRDRIRLPAGSPEAAVLERVRASEKIGAALSGRAPRKVVFVPDRLVNLVVGGEKA
ncbi:MAG TPA: leucine--tRNA ligase [Verrucomicrobiales bacterium]|nr:leucine--tRNA ligase [Verrucomicrobiales bacterium]